MKTNFRYPVEFFALIALVIFVPSLEAPKNIFWLVFVVTWLINRIRDNNFGGAWDFWDNLIGFWIFSGYLISAFAGLHNSEWGGANDLLRYGSILWTLKRSGYSKIELCWLTIAIVFSTFIALSYALWGLYITRTKLTLELNSVGHFNHSAIYLAISYGALLSLVLAFWKKISPPLRILGSLLTALFLISLIFVSISRAAAGIALLITFIIGIVWLKRSKYPLVILLIASMVAGGTAYIVDAPVIQKHESDVKAGIILAYRDRIWNSALVAWRKFPEFGVGMHNYDQISPDKLKAWLEESGKPYVESEYGGAAHAHSLYLNTLAERGLFGTAVLMSVLLAWLYWLIRFAPQRHDDDLEWALWGGSFSAWFVTVGIGFVNTTLHHEHAILSMLLLGIWLSSLKSANREDNSPLNFVRPL